jgi:hypothetical protein
MMVWPNGKVKSPPATEEIDVVGREIESRQGIGSFNYVNAYLPTYNSNGHIQYVCL